MLVFPLCNYLPPISPMKCQLLWLLEIPTSLHGSIIRHFLRLSYLFFFSLFLGRRINCRITREPYFFQPFVLWTGICIVCSYRLNEYELTSLAVLSHSLKEGAKLIQHDFNPLNSVWISPRFKPPTPIYTYLHTCKWADNPIFLLSVIQIIFG